MGLYSDLTDDDLRAKRIELRTALEKATAGGVGAVRGNGRAIEYTRGDTGALRGLLREVEKEQSARRGEPVAGAIGIRWNG